MPKSVCPHAHAVEEAITNPHPLIVDLTTTGEEDDDGDMSVSMDDDNEYYNDQLESLECVQALTSAHSGRVKALARMYDKFVEKLQKAQVAAPQKVSLNVATTTGHTLVEDIKDQAGPSKQVKYVEDAGVKGNQGTLTEAERLDVLEAKMDAVVTFVKGLLIHDLETLGKSYLQDVKIHKESNVVRAKINAFDDELDEVQANYEEVHMLVQNSKKEVSKVKSGLVKLSQFNRKEIQSLKQSLCTVIKKLDEGNEINMTYVEKLKAFLDTLPPVQEEGQGDDKEKI